MCVHETRGDERQRDGKGGRERERGGDGGETEEEGHGSKKKEGGGEQQRGRAVQQGMLGERGREREKEGVDKIT